MAGRWPDVDSAWRRDFSLLWLGQAVSAVGSEMTLVAAPVVAVTTLGASAAQIGLLSAAQTLAFLVVSLPAGLLVDRLGPRRVMLGANLVRLGLAGTVAGLLFGDGLGFPLFLVLTALAGSCAVLFDIAYPTLLPAVVPAAELASANARLGATQSAAQVVGPGGAGFVVGFAGAAVAYLVDACTFVVSLVTLAAVRGRRPETPAASAERPGAAMVVGVRYVLRDGILRAGMLWSGSANVFVVMVESIGALYLLRNLSLPPAVVGVLLACAAVGGVAGGLAARRISEMIGSSRVTWMAMTLFALPGLLIPLAGHGPSVALFAVGWVSWTFSAGVASINLLTYRQRVCPPDILGRVNACIRWVSWGTLPLGGLAGGWLATWLGARATLWVAVIGGCASGLWLLFSPLRLARDLPLTPRPA